MINVAFLEQIPAIVKILLVFIVILIAIRKKISLGTSLFGGSFILGLIFGMPPLSIIETAFFSLIHSKTIALSLVVLLILVLSHSMEIVGQMRRLLDSFQGMSRDPRINLMIFPALIGLLPMPGGAIFSAPMVKDLGGRQELTPSQLSYVNYWFRHIWEYWWPLYPGILLTTTLANLDFWQFVVFLFPLSIMAILSGYWPIRHVFKDYRTARAGGNHSRAPLMPFLRELAPILIVIVIGLGSGSILSVVPVTKNISISKELGLILALVVAILWVWRTNNLSASQRFHILKQRQLVRMFYMIVAILTFKGIMEDSQAVQAVSQELLRWNIPLLPITIILPFLVGGVVGITIAFVGTTFPILITLIHAFNEANFMLPYMMLALVSGFAGVLLSPLHLCLLLSNEFFNTRLEPVYRYLWLPCVALMITGIGYFWILQNILK